MFWGNDIELYDVGDWLVHREELINNYENGYHTTKHGGKIRLDCMEESYLKNCINFFKNDFREKYFVKELNKRANNNGQILF